MSFCVFGNAILKGADPEQALASVSALANGSGLSDILVRTGNGEVPVHLLKSLDSEVVPPNCVAVPFLIASQSETDNSEELIFLTGALASSQSYREFLSTGLKKVQTIVENLFADPRLRCLLLRFTASPGGHYNKTDCKPSEVADIAYQKIRLDDWHSHFELIVEK